MHLPLPPPTPEPAPPAGQLGDDLRALLGALRRGWVFVAASAALGLALGLFHASGLATSYQATARLLVLHQGGRALPGPAGDPLQAARGGADSLFTHVMIIRSPAVVEGAVAAAGVKGLDPDLVAARLTVTAPDPASGVLQIGYAAATREEALGVTRGVIAGYQGFLRDNYQRSAGDTIALFTKARDELGRDLERLEREYLEHRQKDPAAPADGDGGRSAAARRLDRLEEADDRAAARALELRARLDLGRGLLAEGAGAATVAAALARLGTLAGGAGGGAGGRPRGRGRPGAAPRPA